MPNFGIKNVSDEIAAQVALAKIGDAQDKRGLAVGYMLHLARLKPEQSPLSLEPAGKRSCNYSMTDGEYRLFVAFRSYFQPSLDTNQVFFRAALPIGAALYKDGYRLAFPAGKELDFSAAQLVLPAGTERPVEAATP